MNKKNKKSEFSRLSKTLFLKTSIIGIGTILIFGLLYIYVLDEQFGNFILWIFTDVFRVPYETAADIFDFLFRQNLDIMLLGISVILFLIVMAIYLKGFAKYFSEVNSAIDALVQEDVKSVSLSAELSATENKINSIMRTLEERKIQAKEAEQRKNDLVVYLAHDLKTPLTSVVGYLTLLRDEKQISEELRAKYLSISLEKAERLEDLINEFFEITRFNLSAIVLEKSSVHLARLLEQIVFEFKPMLDEKEINCTLKKENDLVITCDADKIQRVFDNLLRNAVNYSYHNSEIFINIISDSGFVKIEFINNGATIPKDKLDKIFEQFFRLDTSRTSASGGAGLGLAISKDIIELHGGVISADSLDEQTVFTVILPL